MMKKLLVGLTIAGALGCNPTTTVNSASAVAEPAGANCAAGGVAIRSGVDVDNDGVISASEAKSTSYVCNGVAPTTGDAGVPPVATLNKVVAEAAGSNCTTGGYAFQTGLDDNGNGQLDAAEVDSTQYLCNAVQGSTPSVRLNKTYLGNAEPACPGGYVRVGFGNDTDGDGTLSSSEQTGSVVVCNSLPKFTSGTSVIVADCNAAPIVIPAVGIDPDGEVVSTTAEVISSYDTLALSTGTAGELHLSPGAHIGNAVIAVTLTDDIGATTVTNVHVIFSGTGCEPFASFYGVDPTSCIAIEVYQFAGDDRSGAIVTGTSVYYNGDNGLVRAGLDLSNAELAVALAVDGLFGDPQQGKLLSLWSSEWDATLADGGTGPGITGLLDPNAQNRFAALGTTDVLDQLVVLDETTYAPTTRVTLPLAITPSQMTFDVAGDAGFVTLSQNETLLAAGEGQALIARFGSNNNGERGALYQLIDTTTGALTLTRAIHFASDDQTYRDYEWNTQEDTFQHYALHKRGSQYIVTYFTNQGAWMELELIAGTPVLLTTSFSSTCDVSNLAFSADKKQVFFHSEYDCFGSQAEESLIRCDVLPVSNLDGAIDDDGNHQDYEGPAIGKRK